MSSFPTEPGLYWAAFSPAAAGTEYDSVVLVSGTAPFLRARSLGINEGGIHGEVSKVPYKGDMLFGPKIDIAIRQ